MGENECNGQLGFFFFKALLGYLREKHRVKDRHEVIAYPVPFHFPGLCDLDESPHGAYSEYPKGCPLSEPVSQLLPIHFLLHPHWPFSRKAWWAPGKLSSLGQEPPSIFMLVEPLLPWALSSLTWAQKESR